MGVAQMKILSVVVAAIGICGCYSTGDGPDPTTALYFPVGLAVSPGGHALYVANSDFDLQFNSGTVEAYHLDDIRNYLAPIWSVDSSVGAVGICTSLGLGLNPTPILYPGPCGALRLEAPPTEYFKTPNNQGLPIASSARIGAFATDIAYACHPPDDPTQGGSDCSRGGPDARGARLFVPVRGDPSVTFFEVDDDRPQPDMSFNQSFRLDCGQTGNNGRCVDNHRVGIDPSENTRGLKLPAEPFGIAVSDRADAIAVTHQIPGGAVSLITGRGVNGGTVMDVKPRLEFVTGGLPAPTTGITALPIPAVVPALGPFALTNYQQGFAVAYRGAAQVDVFRFFDDQFAAPARPFLSRVGIFGLGATPNPLDSRSIVLDRTPRAPRVICEQSCPADDKRIDCLSECTRIPISAFVVNRTPSALLIGEMTTPNPTNSSDAFAFYDAITLAPGPSRAVVGKVQTKEGTIETRIFAICFDARLIFIYDPIKRRLDGQIRTGRGPHALVMDPIKPIAYLGHFTDSYIGLIDLDQSHAGTYASIVATVGAPQPPRDSK